MYVMFEKIYFKYVSLVLIFSPVKKSIGVFCVNILFMN